MNPDKIKEAADKYSMKQNNGFLMLDAHDFIAGANWAIEESLPSVNEAGVIALKILGMNPELSASEQALFVAGFQECIKYLNLKL